MHTESLSEWAHDHAFLGARHAENERRTWIVVALTTVMMVGEIIGGTFYGSMALVADGWHMATHAGALAIAALAYRYARNHVRDARFCFGTGKLGELAGYSSALILAMIALLIGYQSVVRFLNRSRHSNIWSKPAGLSRASPPSCRGRRRCAEPHRAVSRN